MIELVQKPHYHNLVRFAASRPKVLVLGADLTVSCEADGFRDAYPGRFFSMGMAEQNMIGFAGGLAREGFRPFVHTFAVFICRRAYDQVAMAVAYPCLPVRLLGFLPGVTTPGGATHQAIDDVALMRALPNVTVLEVGDATEVESVLEVADGIPGPVYVRMLRGEVPRLFPGAEPLRLGAARLLRAQGRVLVVSSGICTEEASRALDAMARRGLAVAHLHVSTLKPFPPPELEEALASATAGVVTVENHTVISGLGSAVAEALGERGLGRRLVRLGLQDSFSHGASRAALMREHGLDAAAIVRAVEGLAGVSLDLAADDLAPSASPSERTLA